MIDKLEFLLALARERHCEPMTPLTMALVAQVKQAAVTLSDARPDSG